MLVELRRGYIDWEFVRVQWTIAAAYTEMNEFDMSYRECGLTTSIDKSKDSTRPEYVFELLGPGVFVQPPLDFPPGVG